MEFTNEFTIPLGIEETSLADRRPPHPIGLVRVGGVDADHLEGATITVSDAVIMLAETPFDVG